MKPVIKLYAGLITACCMLFAGSLYAAKVPTVDICHYDFDTSQYKLLSVSQNAEKALVKNHPDGFVGESVPDTTNSSFDEYCNIIDNMPMVVARAYIDVDRNDQYSEDDIMIVEVHDLSGNGTSGVGDEVRFGQFPTNKNPCSDITMSTCSVGVHPTVDDFIATSTTFFSNVSLYSDNGFRVSFSKSETQESLQVFDGIYPFPLSLSDRLTPLINDSYQDFAGIINDGSGVSSPRLGDDYFINVEF